MRGLWLAAAVFGLSGGGAASAQQATGSGLANQPMAAHPQKRTEDIWVYMSFTDGAMAWNLNAGKWNQAGDVIEGQRLLWYSKPIVVDGLSVVWAQDFWKIDCKANTYQFKSGEELGANLLTLFTIRAGEPYPIPANSAEGILKQVYCDNKTVPGAEHADGLIGVMAAMQKPKAATP